MGDSDLLRETPILFFRAFGEFGSRLNTRIRVLHIIFIGYAAVVITISLMPSNDITVATYMDKLFHFTMYFFLALLALVAFQSLRSRILALMFTYGLGFMLEWGQGFVADRTPSMTDNLANILGASLGIVVFLLWQKFSDSRLEKRAD
jgi:VanZ family protein